MTRVTIKPRTGGHTEWPNGKQVIYTSDSPPFEVSAETFAAFRSKFILADEPEPDVPVYETFNVPDTRITDVTVDIDAGQISFSVPNTSITDVMAAIEGGQISIDDALDQETKADRPRQSLIRKLSSSILKDGE